MAHFKEIFEKVIKESPDKKKILSSLQTNLNKIKSDLSSLYNKLDNKKEKESIDMAITIIDKIYDIIYNEIDIESIRGFIGFKPGTHKFKVYK